MRTSDINLKKKLNSFFSSEENQKSILNQSEVSSLSKKLNNFYPVIINRWTKVFEKKIKVNHLELVLRRCLVPLTYIFFERCIRSINTQKINKNYSSNKIIKFNSFADIESFEDNASNSVDFNYHLNLNFVKILNSKNYLKLKQKKIKLNNDFRLLNEKAKIKNNLPKYFNLFQSLKNKILIKVEKLVNIFFYYKKILILGSANSEPALINNYFYLNLLSRFNKNKFNFSKNEYNNAERDLIISNIKPFMKEFNFFFNGYGLTNLQIDNLYDYYCIFLKENFPIFFLENLIENYSIIEIFLRKFKKKIVISSDEDSSISTLIFLVGKNLGFKNIKFQHAGGQGYVDNDFTNQIEIKNCDEYITSGWSSTLKNYHNKYVNFHSLPSPWISEKKIFFKDSLKNSVKKFDFVFFPQFVKPFTNGIQGLSNFRRDVIGRHIKIIDNLAKISNQNNLKLGIKFYNKTTEFFLNKTIQKLKKNYFSSVNIFSKIDKGISKELIQETNMLIFDQIGTGVLECFNSKIPVMVIYNGDFNMPNNSSIKFYKNLKKCGVLHEDINSLIREYYKFSSSKDMWMNNKQRKKTINNFCKKFALTDENWHVKWKKYLSKY